MNLREEIKSSVKKPTTFKSFFVLFVTAFTLLLVPLITLGLISQSSLLIQAINSCAGPVEHTFKGATSKTENGVHSFEFSGTNCNLTAWVNGSENVDVSLWIYEPGGNVFVVDENVDESYEFLHVPEPAKEGAYRLVVKLKSGSSSSYTATVSFR